MTTPQNFVTRTDEQKLREVCDALRLDYLDEEASKERIACSVPNDTLGDDVAFSVYCELLNFGPKNDWNGHRSAATRVAREWEARILNPALITGRAMKAAQAL